MTYDTKPNIALTLSALSFCLLEWIAIVQRAAHLDTKDYVYKVGGNLNEAFDKKLEEIRHETDEMLSRVPPKKDNLDGLSAYCDDVKELQQAAKEATIYDKIEATRDLQQKCRAYEGDKWIAAHPSPGVPFYDEIDAQFVDLCAKRHPLPKLP